MGLMQLDFTLAVFFDSKYMFVNPWIIFSIRTYMNFNPVDKLLYMFFYDGHFELEHAIRWSFLHLIVLFKLCKDLYFS